VETRLAGPFASTGWQSPVVQDGLLWVVLALEGGLLLVAANTGFLGGPAVLANMAADSWVPHQYRYLSTQLVTQKGIQLMGLAAFGILVVTGGRVALLVVLYSINVFLTFSLSLLGLCIYWWRARRGDRRWLHRLALSGLGLVVTGSILLVTLVEKFVDGGWMTVVITGVVIFFCLLNHAHYALVRRKIRAADEALGWIAYPRFLIRRRSIPTAIPRCLWWARAVAAAFMHWSGCGGNFRVNFETASL
jgi:hypothetical protein